MPTWTPYVYGKQDDEYGTRGQINYQFLGRLWETSQQLRNDLVKLSEDSLGNPPEKGLKARLKDELSLDLPSRVSVVVVDLENAKMVSPTEGYHRRNSTFYFFLPTQVKALTQAFIDAQKWAEAWYHAVRETGGM